MPRFEPQSATGRMLAARRHREKAYTERNELIAVLAKFWPAHLMPVSGAMHTLDERLIVCVHTPAGPCAWPITQEEADQQFRELDRLEASHWDKATHFQRSMRLATIDPAKPAKRRRARKDPK